jgi:hypothetical protein
VQEGGDTPLEESIQFVQLSAEPLQVWQFELQIKQSPSLSKYPV